MTYRVPGACALPVRTLVASELVDEEASVAVLVSRARAARRRAARRAARAVGLSSVLEGSGLDPIRYMVSTSVHRWSPARWHTLSSQVHAPDGKAH